MTHMDLCWASLLLSPTRYYPEISSLRFGELELKQVENREQTVCDYLNILILIDEKNVDESVALTCCISLLGIKMSVFQLC